MTMQGMTALERLVYLVLLAALLAAVHAYRLAGHILHELEGWLGSDD